MALPNYPIINGHAFSFASVEVNVNGRYIRGIKEIKYEQSVEVGKLTGTSVQKIARTAGQYEPNGSMTLYLHEWNELRAALGQGFMEKAFTITVIYSEYGPLDAQMDVLYGCRIVKVGKGGSEGTEPLEVALDLDIMKIRENGLDPMQDML